MGIRLSSAPYSIVIVGSGFGGSMAAYALAKAGLKTLLLERGSWAKRDVLDWNPRTILLEQRYKSRSPIVVKQGNDRDFSLLYPNEVVGGLSVFFGGASLRLREKDFTAWPISYAELEPYYCKAEQLLEVHGESGQDICEPFRSEDYQSGSIELTRPAKRISAAASRLGYHPFKIPLALNFQNTVRTMCIKCNTCDGFPCKIEAKNDLATTVLPKAQRFGLEIMSGIIVTRLVHNNDRITEVECLDTTSQRRFSIAAKVVVLSAGALHSPAILLRSNLEMNENHRFVGRFLMRHCSAVVTGLFPFETNPESVFHKQLCLTDFYEDFREKFGTATGVIQDIYTPAPEIVRHFAPWGLKWLTGVAAKYAQNLLCIAEDDPCFDNAVSLSNQRDPYGLEIVEVTYHHTRNDYGRRDYLIDLARRILREAGALGSRIYPLSTFSHAMGTLRFGRTPQESVLDSHCQFWGFENLFVLDGSFMPTAGGVNPSLTIAANALRVADYLVANFDQCSR